MILCQLQFTPDSNTLLLWHFDEQKEDNAGFFYSPDLSATGLGAYFYWGIELVESSIGK